LIKASSYFSCHACAAPIESNLHSYVKRYFGNFAASLVEKENRSRSGAEHGACRQNGAVIAFFVCVSNLLMVRTRKDSRK